VGARSGAGGRRRCEPRRRCSSGLGRRWRGRGAPVSREGLVPGGGSGRGRAEEGAPRGGRGRRRHGRDCELPGAGKNSAQLWRKGKEWRGVEHVCCTSQRGGTQARAETRRGRLSLHGVAVALQRPSSACVQGTATRGGSRSSRKTPGAQRGLGRGEGAVRGRRRDDDAVTAGNRGRGWS
jgi:hypothetical protein